MPNKKTRPELNRPVDILKSSQKQHELARQGLGELALSVDFSAAGAFDKFLEDQPTGEGLFKTSSSPILRAVGTKMAGPESDDTKYLKDILTSIFTIDVKTTAAKTEYNESVSYFSKLASKVPTELSARDLIDYIRKIQDDAIKAIKAQHADEKALLNQAFKLEATQNALKSASGNTAFSPEQLEGMRKATEEQMEKKQKELLGAFEKSTTDAVQKVLDAAQKELDRFIFLAAINKDAQVRKDIAGNTTLSMNQEKPLASMADIKKFGNNITRDPDTGTIKVTVDWEFFRKIHLAHNIFTGSDTREQKIEDDLFLAASAVKATGSKGIVLNVTGFGDGTANDKAEKALAAAIKCGFDPKDVKIEINGKLVKHEDLLKNSATLPDLLSRSTGIRKERDEIRNKPFEPLSGANSAAAGAKSVAAVKAALEIIKKEDAAAKATADAAAKTAADAPSLPSGPQ